MVMFGTVMNVCDLLAKIAEKAVRGLRFQLK